MADNFQIKIHDKLYVAFQRHGQNMPHAAMVNYVDNKGNQKKRDNLDSWANYALGGKKALNPVLIDNVPMIGFRMSRNQINAGWANSPSHIRIEDPRGFEVSITINNMIMLTSANVMDNGEIMCECVWGRDNDVNVLLPVNSLPYQEAITNTERLTTHVHVSKLRLGDHVTLKSGQSGRYLGKVTEMVATYQTIQNGQRADSWYKTPGRPYIYNYYLSEGATLHYIEKSVIDKNGVETLSYHGHASPNVSRVEKSDPWTVEEINDRLHDAFIHGRHVNGKSSNQVFLTLGKATTENWALTQTTQLDLEEHIRTHRERKTSGTLMYQFYARLPSNPDELLGVELSSWAFSMFNNFPAEVGVSKITFKPESKMIVKETSDLKMSPTELTFEQLTFDLVVEGINKVYKVKI